MTLHHNPHSPNTLVKISVPAEGEQARKPITRKEVISVFEKANQVARSDSLEALFSGTLDLMIEVAGAESAILYLFDPETEELVFTTVRGDEESLNLVGLRIKKNLWLLNPVTSESKVIIVGDMVNDPVMRTINPAKAANLRNTIVIPLLIEEETFGVIQIYNYELCELDLLEVLANRLVVEADRLMTLAVAQQSNRRLEQLIEMIGRVSGTLDRSLLLKILPEQAALLTNAERSSLFLIDNSNSELGFHASYQVPAATGEKGKDTPVALNLLKLVTSIKAARSNPQKEETGKENSKNSSSFGFSTRSAITVPLQENKVSPGPQQVHHTSTVGGLTVLKMRGEAFDQEDVELLETLANQASIFLQAAELYENVNDLFLDVIKALVAAIDAKDRYTQGHSIRVMEYALSIAEEMNLDPNLVSDIRIGSLLHDVGKIGISDQILSKPGRLTPEEFKMMKKHPVFGRQIMSQVRVLQSALPGIGEHHERLDGSGYPSGLMGDQISIAGRVIAVADVFDAMTTDRPYRQAVSVPDTLAYLLSEGGNLFDRACVQAIDRVIKKNLPTGYRLTTKKKTTMTADHRRFTGAIS